MSLEVPGDAYVLENGRIVHAGTAAALWADEDRIRALASATAEQWMLNA